MRRRPRLQFGKTPFEFDGDGQGDARRVLGKASGGIRFNDHIQYDDAEIVFRHACKMGLEGIVSKRKDLPLPHRSLIGLAQHEEAGQ